MGWVCWIFLSFLGLLGEGGGGGGVIISTPQNSLKLNIEFHLKLHTDYSSNIRNVFSSKNVHKFRWVILVPTTLRRSSDPTNSGCQNDEIYKINCPGSFFICVEIRPSFVYVKLICCVCVCVCVRAQEHGYWFTSFY